MKNETIKGSCDSKGLFKAKNLHPKKTIKGEASDWYKEFEVSHPELFCYTPSNELVTDVGNVEVVGPVWQYRSWVKDNDWWGEWKDTSEVHSKSLLNGDNCIRQVYITVPPTEKADAQPVKEVEKCTNQYCENGNVQVGDGVWQRCLVCNDSAEAIAKEIANKQAPFKNNREREMFIDGVIIGLNRNTQFAIEAGGGKEYKWFIETSFNGNAPIKIALQELCDHVINESECIEVIANAYKNTTTRRSEVDLNEIKNKAIAKAKREYETGKIGFVQALIRVVKWWIYGMNLIFLIL